MLFIEGAFFAFFAVVFLVYWLLPGLVLRKVFLLLASYAFYGAWDYRFLALIIGCSLVNYWLGAALAATQAGRLRVWILTATIIANMGVLAIFKYLNFFAESLQAAASMLGAELSFTTLNIVLPVGISFYIFQTTSYVIDIYTDRIRPCRRVLDFALYVAFFPQLIAGPIVRASEFLPQLERLAVLADVRLRFYLFLFAVGFFKKACVADNLAMFADPVFAQPETYGTYTLWLGAAAYTIQLYCDFSGYSDMAIALAGLLGYHLPQNFNFPYFSRNLGEFWRRWHITLSTWLRDYVYFPLGGSRSSEAGTYRNLLITFGANGLWHGAAWGFVVWGLGNGIGVCIYRAWSRSALGRRVVMPAAVAIAVVMTFIVLVRVPFRTPDLASALHMYGAMFGLLPAGGMVMPVAIEPLLLALVLVHWVFYRYPVFEMIERLPQIAFAGMMGAAAAVAIAVLPVGYSPFIYFQF
jgi:alginate O-acetyltransferase complex protein AlgI